MTIKIIHKELSYKIVGVLFEVFDELGYGYKENFYTNAIARSFKIKGMHFNAQVPYKLIYKGGVIGKIFLDFLIESKIILEVKRGNYYSKKNIEQILNYLKMTGLELAILANFTPNGVKFIRILNSAKFREKQGEEYNLSVKKKMFRL